MSGLGQTELILGDLKKPREVLSREKRKIEVVDEALETILSTAKHRGKQHRNQRMGPSRD